MKNQDSRSERLSEGLTGIDDDLLDEAYSVDSADKLKKVIGSEKSCRKIPFTQRPAFRGVIAAAACLAVTVGAVFAVPALFKTDDIIVEPKTSGSSDVVKPPKTDITVPNAPKTGNLPPMELPTANVQINSIDKLNYYSAVRILTDSSNSPLSRLSAGSRNPYGKNSYGISLLSADVTTEPYNTPGPPAGQDPPPLPPDEDPEIYYYEFDPDQVFYIRNVTFFQIELTEKTGFLASKIGIGVADVVISDDFIFGDSIITFKNGDRYFSCLTNGFTTDESTGRRTYEFSTHKYIEGFHVVKNFEQENYAFYVSFDGDQVDYFECAVWDKGENPDGVLPVVSETYISNETAEYTIAELENYFNGWKQPEQGWDNGQVYQWEDFLLNAGSHYGEDYARKLELAEFPDTIFIWRGYSIYAYENGQERRLVEGMPILNAYFTDLNGDGYPELCTTVAFGSGIVDEHVVVYDYHNDIAYYLWDRMSYDYILFPQNGELYVRQLQYYRDSMEDDPKSVVGRLEMGNGKLIMSVYGQEYLPLPNIPFDEDQTLAVYYCSDNNYFIALRTDGTFQYGNAISSAYPHRGEYEAFGNKILFRLYGDHEIIEDIVTVADFGFSWRGDYYKLTQAREEPDSEMPDQWAGIH